MHWDAVALDIDDLGERKKIHLAKFYILSAHSNAKRVGGGYAVGSPSPSYPLIQMPKDQFSAMWFHLGWCETSRHSFSFSCPVCSSESLQTFTIHRCPLYSRLISFLYMFHQVNSWSSWSEFRYYCCSSWLVFRIHVLTASIIFVSQRCCALCNCDFTMIFN